MINYGSICSGIEAATVAWHPLGWQAEWFAEIEPFPSAVLAYRWPEVSNLGDMTKLARQVLAGSIAAPEVLVGGTPCQAFSVAGMRAGLDDPRGQLTIKYVELADAVDHVRPAGAECIVVWENVPGVLSDKGNAFGCFLGALVGESDALQPSGGKWTDAGCVYGPRRAAAWRVLDAQYFGLAQRRRRVFVVASARAGFDPAAVLFESESVRRDTAPSRGQGENAAGTIAGGARRNGGYSTDDIPLTAGSLRAQAQCSHREDSETFIPVAFGGNNTSGPIDVAPARNACASASGRMDFESEAFVVQCVTGDITHTLKAEGFDASEDGTGRGQPIVFDPTQITSAANRSNPLPGDPCHTLAKGMQPPTLAGSQVRRLTPRECERLQGFPDDYTLIPWRGKPAEECPDGPRYKAIGNSKAVPVVRWIGRRIQRELERAQ
ncbi:DNA cytosine methyltransferase [Ectopseudomonas mendocina]|nr:DNA cytosine methyltransferase [Pseudomonas mendocina]